MSMISISGRGCRDHGLFGLSAWAQASAATVERGWGASRSPSQRAGAAVLVLILHALVIALVLISRAEASIEMKPALATFDIASRGGREPTAHRSHPHHEAADTPSISVQLPVPVLNPITVIQPFTGEIPVADIQPAVIAVGGSCDLTQPVQDALRQSADLRRHLPDIPADRRSIANAIAVWNVNWAKPGAAPAQAAFATIRQTIIQTVLAASADCRSQLQAGPRLIYLPGDFGKTTVLALGSGRWTWQQVVDGIQVLPAETAGAGSAPVLPGRLATVSARAAPAAAQPSQTPDLDTLLASLVRQRSPSGQPFYP